MFWSVTAIVSILVLIAVGSPCIAAMAIHLAALRRRPVDASHLEESPPQHVSTAIDELTALGFDRYGEIQIRLPFVTDPATTWLLTDPPQTTCAEVVDYTGTSAMVGLTTTYTDGAVTETAHPVGERIQDDDFGSHTITSTIEDAYRYHLEQAEAFSHQHGTPCRYARIGDYLRRDDAYRRRHMARQRRRLMVAVWTSVLALGYGLLTCAVFLLAQQWSDLTWATGIQRLSLLAKLLAPAAIATLIISQVVALGSRRDSRKIRPHPRLH